MKAFDKNMTATARYKMATGFTLNIGVGDKGRHLRHSNRIVAEELVEHPFGGIKARIAVAGSKSPNVRLGCAGFGGEGQGQTISAQLAQGHLHDVGERVAIE